MIKRTFLDSSRQDLSSDIQFDWFGGCPHFSIVFGNDIIMTSFLVTWFSNLHILWNLSRAINLQSFNAVGWLDQVLQRDYIKHNEDFIMTSFHNFGIGYQPAKFQIPQLSKSNFTEVGIRHPKNHYDLIMTSIHNMWFSKLHIL